MRATTSPANTNQRESQLRRATSETAVHQQQRQQRTSKILASPFLSSPAKFEFKDESQQIRLIAEQESMSETVQQIKEQVMNLARRPTTSAPDDTDDESDDDDYVEPTP
uniref:Uncharacterized protein n=1 Tax=Solanum tuberosum TaxID=4113 RepID=M1DII1_SOLTU